MNKWIDSYIDGLVEYCETRDVFEIYNILDIKICKLDKNNSLIIDNEALYIRNYFGDEIVFIREDLPYKYMKFVLSHELAHAIIHTDIPIAAFNNKLINKSKFEHQADYFALKLLDIFIDKVYYDGCTFEQVAKSLCVRDAVLEYEFG